MKRVAVFLVVSLTLGLASSLIQAEELTLDKCIELALEKRATIIRARGGADQAGAAKTAALGAFLPRLSASYNWSKGKDYDIEPAEAWFTTAWNTVLDTIVLDGRDTAVTGFEAADSTLRPIRDEQDIGPNKSIGLSANMALFDLSNWFDLSAASAAKDRAKLDVLASEQDLISAVKISYYAYLATIENVAVQEEAEKRAEEQLKLIESRFELGSASKSDVLKQKVQHGNDQLALLEARNSVIRTDADLAFTIGLDPREEHTFSTDYRVREYEGSLDDAVAFGMDHNPSLLGSTKTADQARHTLRSAKSGYLPSVSAFASFRKSDGTQAFPFAVDFGSKSYSYGFQISLNIFDGFLRENRVTAARVFRNNAMADLADVRNSTIANVKTSYLDIDKSKKQIEVSQENVAAAEEDLRITQEKYNLGAATILDLLDAQVSLKEAQVALIRVQFDLNLAVARLENAMGKM